MILFTPAAIIELIDVPVVPWIAFPSPAIIPLLTPAPFIKLVLPAPIIESKASINKLWPAPIIDLADEAVIVLLNPPPTVEFSPSLVLSVPKATEPVPEVSHCDPLAIPARNAPLSPRKYICVGLYPISVLNALGDATIRSSLKLTFGLPPIKPLYIICPVVLGPTPVTTAQISGSPDPVGPTAPSQQEFTHTSR